MVNAILHSLKKILFFMGLLLLIPTVFSLVLKQNWIPFLFAAALLMLLGVGFRKVEKINRGQSLTVAALCWLIIPLICSIPFFMYGLSIENAIFESMSGWTATGLSFVENIEALPTSLLFFRSFIQWVGGLGIVIFALMILKAPSAPQLYLTERREEITVDITRGVRVIIGIYGLLTAIGAVLLILSGMNIFDAINHAMTAIATGGFSTQNNLALSAVQKMIFMLIMLWGGISFAVHYNVLKGKFKAILLSSEIKVLFIVLAIAITLIFIASSWVGGIDSAFHAISAITGTGFQTINLSLLGNFSKYILILLMLSGACSGSTTGALKLWRVIVLLKSIAGELKKAILPRGAVVTVKVNQVTLGDEDVKEAGMYIFLYVSVALVAFGILLSLGLPAMDSLFTVASAQGNVGLTSLSTWFSLPMVAKAILVFCMWVGRIEILPAFMLFRILKR